MNLNVNSFVSGMFKSMNLDEWYLKNINHIPDTKIPQQIQDRLAYFSYGGYAEDRKHVWKGTYLDESGGYIHLGIDIVVPPGTPVKAPFDAKIINRFSDTDDKIGWGGRLILEFNKECPLIVLAHLEPKSMTNKKNVRRGDLIGEIGTWPTNGNTFHHLHVQCIKHNDFNNFDGYGFSNDLENNPNPFQVNFQ
jgi:murein DD-endopeptidase MepM/ murein hydrolase activator NlpD